jgi:hypothetical protein
MAQSNLAKVLPFQKMPSKSSENVEDLYSRSLRMIANLMDTPTSTSNSFLQTWFLKEQEELFSQLTSQRKAQERFSSEESYPVAKRPPIEEVRDLVRRDVMRLREAIPDLDNMLTACIDLKQSLNKLERDAARYGYEPLSRVAAILHDTLKHNFIEDLDEQNFQGFFEATRQATEGRADHADPRECDLTLIQAGLSWLPGIPQFEETDLDD